MRNFCVFWKNDPLLENFQNSVPKVFGASLIDVLCSNLVKSGLREIGEVVRYLPGKKNKKIACLSRSRYCADRVQNLPGPAPDNVLRVIQISSKTAYFRRSYNRTREHRRNAPKSKSNIRPKPVLEPNKDV